MLSQRIAVLGAGTAGLAASLLLARDGHQVCLIERDPFDAAAAGGAHAWNRKGIPHFLQPHAFIPRGRRELLAHFGDVHASLKLEGASDVDVGAKLPGTAQPQDAELQFMGVRRPLIEWAFRKAVLAQAGIEVHSGCSVRGVRWEHGRVAAVERDGPSIDVDLVVDAMGRRSPLSGWLEAQGITPPTPQRSECGVIYYSRYYQVRPGRVLPDGPWLMGPRGDLGYMGFSSFPGDNGTFATVLAVPTGVPELKVFRHETVYEAAIAHIPALRAWVNADLVEPITGVLAMGGLQNSIDSVDDHAALGAFRVGDALCHTDPVLAHGISLSLIHAVEIVRALREHAALPEALASYQGAVMPTLRERYEFATALDEQRLRMWTGGPVDFTRRAADYALFSMVAAGAVALVDPEVFRVFVRRVGLLDSTRVLDHDEPLQERIELQFREMLAKPRPASGPSREAMLSLAEAALER